MTFMQFYRAYVVFYCLVFCGVFFCFFVVIVLPLLKVLCGISTAPQCHFLFQIASEFNPANRIC